MTDSRSRFDKWLREANEPMNIWEMWQAAEAETARKCSAICEKAEIQTVAAKGRETAARINVAIKAAFPEAWK